MKSPFLFFYIIIAVEHFLILQGIVKNRDKMG